MNRFSLQLGKKYGLVRPEIPLESNANAHSSILADDNATSDVIDVFNSNANSGVSSELEVHLAKKRKMEMKAQEQASRILQDDPTAFAYDEVYDNTMKAKPIGPIKSESDTSAVSSSKYIPALLAKAADRQVDRQRVWERQLIREQEKDAHLYGDKEKFITAAYAQKLEEDRITLDVDMAKERMELANDVTKQSDLSGFYRNLLNGLVDTNQNMAKPLIITTDKIINPFDKHVVACPSMKASVPVLQSDNLSQKDSQKQRRWDSAEIKPEIKPLENCNPEKLLVGDRRNNEASITAAKARYVNRKSLYRGKVIQRNP